MDFAIILIMTMHVVLLSAAEVRALLPEVAATAESTAGAVRARQRQRRYGIPAVAT